MNATEVRKGLIKRGFAQVETGNDLPQGTTLWVGKLGWKDPPLSVSYIAVYLMEMEGSESLFGYLPYYFWSKPRKQVDKFLRKNSRWVFDNIYTEKLTIPRAFEIEDTLFDDLRNEADWGQGYVNAPQI